MTVTRNLTKTLLMPCVVLGTLYGSPAASAATGSHVAANAKGPGPAAKQRVLRQGMNVVGFNAAIARAHGYKIVTYANGDQQSVPITPGSHLPKSPILRHDRGLHPDANSDYNKVIGNCGTSWIAVMQTGPSQVQMASGFGVNSSPAVGYSWTVTLTDANGTSQQSASGALFLRTSWGRSWNNLNQHGFTHDFVSSGLADLEDGTICYAGRPDVSIGGLA